jgi:hypothetical protein
MSKDILNNIDGYLYNDCQALVRENETFGNNVYKYLKTGFNFSSYL